MTTDHKVTFDSWPSADGKPQCALIRPETFRLPSGRDRDPFFGLGRSYWNEQILPTPRNGYKPPIKSYVIRKKGSHTGVRLIDFESALQFILAHQEESWRPHESTT